MTDNKPAEISERLNVLLIAPSLDGNTVGELEWSFHWAEALSRMANVTVLATSRLGKQPLAEQLPMAQVVTWPEPAFLYQKLERINAMAKPSLPLFARQVRKWLRQQRRHGRHFDIAHQLLPQAMRHATPLLGMGIPYVIGVLGGALTTPAAFQSEVRQSASMAARLRAVDAWRLRHDPWLRASYREAELILGVAPYVQEKLDDVGIKRFHPMMERGHGAFAPDRDRHAIPGKLDLLHVGRVVRTKGLRDVVRAMAHLRDLPQVRLTSAGSGEDLEACKAEAVRLGVEDRITFLGKIKRADVESEYAKSDVFCFPSFREPMGGVFFEAMAHSLPVITAARGGPDFIIDDTCGIRLPVETPKKFAADIGCAIRELAQNPERRLALGVGSRARLESFGSWDDKANTLIRLYHDLLAQRTKSER